MRNRKVLGAVGLALVGLGLYKFRQHFFGRWLGLRPVRYKVLVRRGLRVPMPDEVNLAADHYAPAASRLFPTILIRTPYGRSGAAGWSGLSNDFIAQRFAERGYNVIVQDVRGRFDSEGNFEPFVNEASDGRATLEWIEAQAWFNGVLGMWGQSYLGYVQWAVAPGAPLYLKAMMPCTSGSRLPGMNFRDGALALDTLLRWIIGLDDMHHTRGRWGIFQLGRYNPRRLERQVERGAQHLPIGQADQKAVGSVVPFYQEWLEHPSSDDPYWKQPGRKVQIRNVTAAAHLVAGWYDIFLRETLEDYAALYAAGQRPYLTIGPWGHVDLECLQESLRQGMLWFDAHLKGDHRSLRARPVRLYVMGEETWREMESWPPPAQARPYFLQASEPGGALALDAPIEQSSSSAYTYDPNNPTPAVGGALMSMHAGSVDNRKLEARPDVLVFTTPPLNRSVEVIGPVRLRLYVHSSLAYTDFVGRLCDVFPDGRSMNICDGLLHVQPGVGQPQPDDSLCVDIDLWATAHCFMPGHRIRLQISSGAHPRWNRNLGNGEALASATHLTPAQQTIYHDSDHPSALILPVTNL